MVEAVLTERLSGNQVEKGDIDIRPYDMTMTGSGTMGTAWDATNNILYNAHINSGGGGGQTCTQRKSTHGPVDYRSTPTGGIRIRCRRVGTITSATLSLYINGVVDSTINGVSINPASNNTITDFTFTPGSTINPDDNISFVVVDTIGTNGNEFDLIIIDWNFYRKVTN